MRVVVTGGAGFIGSHFSRRLLADGHKVEVFDNLLTGSIDNIKDLLQDENFLFHKQDVTNYIHVFDPVDAVVHLASPASPADFERLPIEILKVGSLGTHNALGLAKRHGATFLLASTSEVYGDPEVNPQSEEYLGRVNPIGIRGVYDEAKRFAESITMAYHRNHGLDTRIARIFNTFGPNMQLNDGRAIPNFFTQALRGEPLTIYGDGKQTRSFMYVEDLVQGLYNLLFYTSEALPVNLGNPEERSLLDMAQWILNITESNSDIAFLTLPPDDPKVRCPDITKARSLGWEPVWPLEEGLFATMEYFKEKLNG